MIVRCEVCGSLPIDACNADVHDAVRLRALRARVADLERQQRGQATLRTPDDRARAIRFMKECNGEPDTMMLAEEFGKARADERAMCVAQVSEEAGRLLMQHTDRAAHAEDLGTIRNLRANIRDLQAQLTSQAAAGYTLLHKELSEATRNTYRMAVEDCARRCETFAEECIDPCECIGPLHCAEEIRKIVR